MGFAHALNAGGQARLLVEPARSGVVSWNAHALAGTIAVRPLRNHEPDGDWVDLFEWSGNQRTSLSPQRDGMSVAIDVVDFDRPIDGIDVRLDGGELDLVAFSTPAPARPSLPYGRDALILDVAVRSQFIVEGERGWCSPTSLSMLHAYHGIDIPTEETAARVFDTAYNGTGNWSFNVAYSGSLGFVAVVAHLDGLDRAQRCIERGLPLAISYSWSPGELRGAPVEHSDGHLVVLRGFTANGDCAINDPAHPDLCVVYPRAEIERLWQRAGGVAYLVAPGGIPFDDILA
jgi:hypothetical protein